MACGERVSARGRSERRGERLDRRARIGTFDAVDDVSRAEATLTISEAGHAPFEKRRGRAGGSLGWRDGSRRGCSRPRGRRASRSGFVRSRRTRDRRMCVTLPVGELSARTSSKRCEFDASSSSTRIGRPRRLPREKDSGRCVQSAAVDHVTRRARRAGSDARRATRDTPVILTARHLNTPRISHSTHRTVRDGSQAPDG